MEKAATDAYNAAKNAVSSAGSAVSNAVKSVMPHFASGGIVPASPGGTAVVVGEGGEDEAIIPTSRLSAMLGNGGGMGNVSILAGATVVMNNGTDINQLANAVAQKLARTLQSQRSGLSTAL